METYKKFIAENPKVEMIHISMDDDQSVALDWAREESFPWLTVLERDQNRKGLLSLYKTNRVPTYLLVDNEAKIIHEGYSTSFAKIKELAKEED